MKPAGKLLNVKQMLQKQYILLDGLPDEWKQCIGEVEDTFTCIAWGLSANGKTNFVAALAKALSNKQHGILYVCYEEGHGKTIQKLIERSGLHEYPVQFLDHASFPDLVMRLKRKKSPKIIVIDSLQYSRFTYEQYQELKKLFVFGKTPQRRKIFIFISHAKGRQPSGQAAIDIRYDANIKVHVEGFVADIESRYSSVKNYVIWEDRARAYWGKKYRQKLNKLSVKTHKKKPVATTEAAEEVINNIKILPPLTAQEAALQNLKNSQP